MRNVTLILDDGSRFSGKSFGYEKPVAGEVVFNTAMTGYPESLTDPSYAGQLMTLTYPLVGNYGVPPFTIEPNGLATFMESEKIHAEAIIVSDYSYEYSHWNAVESLGDWLKREKVPGITGIDTRELTKVLREHGVMMGKIVFENEELRMKNEEFPSYSDINYVDQVSCKEIIHYFPSGTSSHSAANSSFFIPHSSLKKVVLVDCGVKTNIIRCLLKRNVEVIRVQEHGIELTEGELRAPAVIHAKLGAWMAEHKYGITDPEVLSAIACHTTGKPAMSLLDKILYVADYIEPRRDKAPNLPKLRRLAFEDLDEALYQILDSTRNYLKETGTAEDDTTEQTWEYYHERHVHQ